MKRHKIHSTDQAIIYLVECTLATVCKMAMNKRRGKGEFERQIEIAQNGCDWINNMGLDVGSTRISDVRNFNWSVSTWSAQYIND